MGIAPTGLSEMECSVAQSLEVIGEWWTTYPLVFRANSIAYRSGSGRVIWALSGPAPRLDLRAAAVQGVEIFRRFFLRHPIPHVRNAAQPNYDQPWACGNYRTLSCEKASDNSEADERRSEIRRTIRSGPASPTPCALVFSVPPLLLPCGAREA